jgi:ABC-type multidrug transport system permease subunit
MPHWWGPDAGAYTGPVESPTPTPTGAVMAPSHPLAELYLTRLREFYRQPARIFWVYGFPIILAIVLGVAFQNRPPETLTVTVADVPALADARAALERPAAQAARGGRPGIRVQLRPEAQALHALRTGKTPLVVLPGPSGQGVTYRFDPTRPEAAVARAAVDDALQRAEGRQDVVAVHDEPLIERGSRYIDFLIPGLMGLNTMGGGLWGIGFLLVNFRIGKLLKRFAATPMPRRDFLLALLGARLTFLIPDAAILLALGVFAFKMPVRGSLLLVSLILILGALAFAGIGLLVASRAQTTETVSGLMNLVMLPMWLFSGVFFSSDRFPPAMQPFIQALPLTQVIGALRRVMLEGAGFLDVGGSLALLAAWAAVTFVVALRIFRWS